MREKVRLAKLSIKHMLSKRSYIVEAKKLLQNAQINALHSLPKISFAGHVHTLHSTAQRRLSAPIRMLDTRSQSWTGATPSAALPPFSNAGVLAASCAA
jgi:hypothetical protein